MNKAELVAQVAKESDLSKDAAEKAVDATFKNIEKALKGGDTVRIVGFGNFQVAQRKASRANTPLDWGPSERMMTREQSRAGRPRGEGI